jgi:hypothetical protein
VLLLLLLLHQPHHQVLLLTALLDHAVLSLRVPASLPQLLPWPTAVDCTLLSALAAAAAAAAMM